MLKCAPFLQWTVNIMEAMKLLQQSSFHALWPLISKPLVGATWGAMGFLSHQPGWCFETSPTCIFSNSWPGHCSKQYFAKYAFCRYLVCWYKSNTLSNMLFAPQLMSLKCASFRWFGCNHNKAINPQRKLPHDVAIYFWSTSCCNLQGLYR